MVAKFVSVEDFAVRAGLGDVDGLADEVTAKARAALEAATTHLISIVRTEFDEDTSITDTYYVDSGELPFVGQFPRFFLSQGFVTTLATALVVKTSDQLSTLAAATSLDTGFLVLDQSKGTMLITGTDRLPITSSGLTHGNRYFTSVTYAAGFTAADDAFGSLYASTPEWLKEAAIILAQSIFATGQPCEPGDKNSLGCPCDIESLVNRYLRFLPSALKPIS
jgi:hypothetical protein